jgi:hypothetical protein
VEQAQVDERVDQGVDVGDGTSATDVRAFDAEGERLAVDPLHGGAKSAGCDDDIGAGQCLANSLCDPPGIVADGLGAEQVHAQRAQETGDETCIGIRGLTEQEFGADGNDLCSGHVGKDYTTRRVDNSLRWI